MSETLESIASLLGLGPEKALQPPRFAKVTAVSSDTVTVTLGASTAEAVRCCVCAVDDVVLLETLPNGTLAAVGARGQQGGGGGVNSVTVGTVTGATFANSGTASDVVLDLDVPAYTRHVMTRYRNTALSSLANNTYTVVPMTSDISAGTLLTASGNGIKIGAGVTRVLVSASLAFDTVGGSAASRYIRICRNSYSDANTIGWNYRYMATGQANVLVVPATLAEVAEGDVLYMYYYARSQDTIGGNAHPARTGFTVEVVS